MFPKLVARHTVPENQKAAASFGARLRASGRPIADCDGIEASLRDSCVTGFGAGG